MAKSKYVSSYSPVYKPTPVPSWLGADLASVATISKRHDLLGAAIERYKTDTSSNPFNNYVLEVEYVGSRVTCNPAPTDTDMDILVLTDALNPLINNCKAWGFTGGEVYFKSDGSYASDFYSLRKDDVNLIVTESKEWFDKFMLATAVCKKMNVLKKKDRVLIFSAILYQSLTPQKGY